MKENRRQQQRAWLNSATCAITATVAALAHISANAQSFAPHAYIGGAFGASTAQGDFAGQVFRAGQTLTSGNVIANIRSDRSDTGGKAFVGYQFHRNLAAELSYMDFGRFNGSYDFSGPNSFSKQYLASWRADGVALDLVGSIEVMPKLSVMGRAGLMRSSLKYSQTTLPINNDPSSAPTENQTRPRFGLALGYDFTSAIGAQLGWERTVGIGRNFSFVGSQPERSNGKLDYDLLSLGITYRFR